MNLTVSLSDASKLDACVWEAQLDPHETSVFKGTSQRRGAISILLLDREPELDSTAKTLTFKLNSATLLNAGNSSQVIVIKSESHGFKSESTGQLQHGSGDEHFLHNLPESLQELGSKLLAELRKTFSGELVFHPTSGKYVETPNFWTVRIQPRDRSLRITVYGLPDSFHVNKENIKLTKDMSSYSAFKINSLSQLNSSIAVIKEAYSKKLAGKPGYIKYE